METIVYIENTVADTINATYARRMMGRLDVKPAVFSMEWYKIPNNLYILKVRANSAKQKKAYTSTNAVNFSQQMQTYSCFGKSCSKEA